MSEVGKSMSDSVRKKVTGENQKNHEKIVLLKKEPSIYSHVVDASDSGFGNVHLMPGKEVHVSLTHADATCPGNDGLLRDGLVEVAETEYVADNVESTNLNVIHSLPLPPSEAFSGFVVTANDSKKHVEDLLRKLKLDNKSNAFKEGDSEQLSLKNQNSVELLKSQNTGTSNAFKHLSSNADIGKFKGQVGGLSCVDRCLQKTLGTSVVPPSIKSNKLHFAHLPQPSRPFRQQNQSFQPVNTPELFNYMSLSPSCCQQLKPGFCDVKLPVPPRPCFLPKKPLTESCVNFPIQPQCDLLSARNKFNFSKCYHSSRNKRSSVPLAGEHQTRAFGSASSFCVPDNMTPTQVIRKKVPLSSLRDAETQDPSTSAAAQTAELVENQRLPCSQKNFSNAIDDKKIVRANEKTSDQYTEDVINDRKMSSKKLGNRKSYSPDLESIPDLKVATDVSVDLTETCSANDISVLEPSNSVNTEGQKTSAERNSLHANKLKFRFLGSRKSRLAARFD
uniref:PDZ domain-containing protein n=1 Tax=Syphacia muris TaxID=451379 RepID=A0A0N5B1F1_9BILA